MDNFLSFWIWPKCENEKKKTTWISYSRIAPGANCNSFIPDAHVLRCSHNHVRETIENGLCVHWELVELDCDQDRIHI